MKAEISSRYEVLYGNATQEAMDYKRKMLRLFLSNGRAIQTRRILLIICPNGEWRSTKIQYYVALGGPGREMTESEILEHLTNLVLLSTSACSFLISMGEIQIGCCDLVKSNMHRRTAGRRFP